MRRILSEEFSDWQAENSDGDNLKLWEHDPCAMGTPIQRPEAKIIGRRLRDFRFGLANFLESPSLKTLRFFAEKTDVPENNLTAWELGRANVPYWYIQRLKEKFGISFLFEWIYGGDITGLSGRLAEAIEEQRRPKAVPKVEPVKRRKRRMA